MAAVGANDCVHTHAAASVGSAPGQERTHAPVLVWQDVAVHDKAAREVRKESAHGDGLLLPSCLVNMVVVRRHNRVAEVARPDIFKDLVALVRTHVNDLEMVGVWMEWMHGRVRIWVSGIIVLRRSKGLEGVYLPLLDRPQRGGTAYR